MKNSIYIVVFITLISLLGCSRTESNVFEATPAERMNNALKSDLQTLVSAKNGWIMEYFATTTSGGYPLLVKFDSSGLATFGARNRLTLNMAYQTDSSLFEMIGDDGPVLTFNTFNKILHVFSNPENPDGYGLQGDYEFIITSTSSNQVVLKGKKRGVTILLNKLAENQSCVQYANATSAVDSILFNGNSPKLTLKIGTSTYSFAADTTHVFTVTKSGISLKIPFILNPAGLHFLNEQELGGLKFKTFTLNSDRSALVSVENNSYKLTGADDLAAYFLTYVISWKLERSAMSQNLQMLYDQIVQACQTRYNAQTVSLIFKYNSIRHSYTLNLSYFDGTTTKDGNIDFSLNSTGKNGLTLNYKATGDVNGLAFYNDITGFKDLATSLSNAFTLSSTASINPQQITFTRNSDAGTWVTMKQ